MAVIFKMGLKNCMEGLFFLVGGQTRDVTHFVRWGRSLRFTGNFALLNGMTRNGSEGGCVGGGLTKNRCIGFLLSFLGRIGLLGRVCLLTR
jgi:hypothetical protein